MASLGRCLSRFPGLVLSSLILGCSPAPEPAAIPAPLEPDSATTAEPTTSPETAERPSPVRDPEGALVLANLGDRIVTVNVAGAIDHYVAAIELDPENPLLYWKLGHAYARVEDFPRFVQAMQQAANLDPNDARYWDRLAYAHTRVAETRTESWPEALDAAARCLAVEAGRHECEHSAGLAEERLGRAEKALAHYHAAIDGARENGRYHLALVALLLDTKRYPDARRALETAVLDVPTILSQKEPLYQLQLLSSELARIEKNLPRAIDALEQAHAIAGDVHPEVAFELGRAYGEITPPNAEKSRLLLLTFVKRVCRGAGRARFEHQCVEAEQRLHAP